MGNDRFSLALADRARRFSEELQRAARGEVSGVHRARVASRRLREAVPVAVTAGLARLGRRERRALRRVAAALGRVRELDVTRELLASETLRHGWAAGIVDQITRSLVAERRTARAELQRILKRPASRDLLSVVRRLARPHTETGRTPSASPMVLTALAERRQKRAVAVVARLRVLGTLYVPERLHEVRLAAKKLRYSLELERSVRRRAASRDLRMLETIQDGLGRLHDLQVLEDRIRRLMRSVAKSRAAVAELGRMQRDLEGECRRLHAGVVNRAGRWCRMCERINAERISQDR